MRVRLRQLLRTLRRDDSGQSLIVVVSAMTVMLGIAGFGIDTATWMVRHHNAQVVADSAALAAAQCLADPNQASTIYVSGSQQTVPKCKSSKDITDAQTVAVDYAAANGLTISPSDVSVSHDVVTVNASTNAPGLFARLFGIGTVSQTAHAGAGWKSSSGSCSNPGSSCDFMFANSSDCGAGSIALNISPQGNSTINGNIQTNGNIDVTETGNAGGINGTGNFGAGSNCTSTQGGNHDGWKSGDPTQATQAMTWPIDYSKDFPACGGSGDPCQTNGYPSFCGNEGTDVTVGTTSGLPPSDKPSPGIIYCASGSGNPADPSTWNGSITIEMSGNNIIEDSFVGGTITYTGDGGDTISACGWTATGFDSSSCSAPTPAGGTANYPIFYAVGNDPNPASCAAGTDPSTSCAFYMQSGGNLTLDGDMFVMNGMASFDFHGGQSAGDTFIEANTIAGSLDGNFNGDGPTPGGGGGPPIPGSISLVQ